METVIDGLIGATIKKIYFNEDFLKFETDIGNFVYGACGDCCSETVFYDFYGVKKLLKGNKIVAVKEVDLLPGDIERDAKSYQESIRVYGYQIFTLDKELGEVTSVFSFRNYSNGYYGGEICSIDERKVLPEIFDDVIETESIREEI